MHEDISRKTDVKMGGERGFGFVFAVVFALIGLFPLIGGGPPRWWSLGIAGLFVLVALVYPRVLRPLNVLWFKFGMLLHHVVTPVVLGLIFFIAVTPTGVIMRLLGKRPLPLEPDPAAASYWIHREPPGPEPKSLDNQF